MKMILSIARWDAKFNAVADDIAERHAAGQPCLVGTVSIESSERLSRLLSKRGIKHEVLNAKNHERLPLLLRQVAQVRLPTNMAGRGTDICWAAIPKHGAGYASERFGEDEEPTPAQVKQAEAEAEAITNRESKEVLAAGGLCNWY